VVKTPSGLTGMQRRYAKTAPEKATPEKTTPEKTTPEKRPADAPASPPSKAAEARKETPADPSESDRDSSDVKARRKRPWG
jgi:hypothetical protein